MGRLSQLRIPPGSKGGCDGENKRNKSRGGGGPTTKSGKGAKARGESESHPMGEAETGVINAAAGDGDKVIKGG